MSDPGVSATRVLAVASHVVSGYVGNKVVVCVLQALGYDVAALNTVQFSNHTGYRQWTGTKALGEEIMTLYQGLRQSRLDDFDMMISGYLPSAEAVRAVGAIADELKMGACHAPGSFFWVLDPVMGDNGKTYVAQDVVPAYRALISRADLILPNQFEAELLSGVEITNMDSLARAVQSLHDVFRVPHIIITSVKLPTDGPPTDHLSVVGSSITSSGGARLFAVEFPSIDCYFSGTGDMFAALVAVRMCEAVLGVQGLSQRSSWLSEDNVPAGDLPLARATEKVLGSMHDILSRTRDGMSAVTERTMGRMSQAAKTDRGQVECIQAKAAELQLVQNLRFLQGPTAEFKAKPI